MAARKRPGLRQIDAAREIGVCRETVARIEIDHIPSAETREKVLRWLEAQEATVRVSVESGILLASAMAAAGALNTALASFLLNEPFGIGADEVYDELTRVRNAGVQAITTARGIAGGWPWRSSSRLSTGVR